MAHERIHSLEWSVEDEKENCSAKIPLSPSLTTKAHRITQFAQLWFKIQLRVSLSYPNLEKKNQVQVNTSRIKVERNCVSQALFLLSPEGNVLPGDDGDTFSPVHDQWLLLAELDLGRGKAEGFLHALENTLPGGLRLLDDGRAFVDVFAQVA